MVVRKGPIAWAVSLTLVASVALGPSAALAQRAGRGSSGGRVVVGNPAGSRPSAHHRFAPNSFAPRSFFHRGFTPLGTIVVYAPLSYGPSSYYGSPSYYDPSLVYAPPAMYGPPTGGTVSLAPPPPMPSVIEYPTGRYELRGDGITAPYRWVWIPNPPPAPPADAPPAGAPASPAPPASRDPGPVRHTALYRWTDAQGVVHLTDRRGTVPDRSR
jgi:hypothetical protein